MLWPRKFSNIYSTPLFHPPSWHDCWQLLNLIMGHVWASLTILHVQTSTIRCIDKWSTHRWMPSPIQVWITHWLHLLSTWWMGLICMVPGNMRSSNQRHKWCIIFRNIGWKMMDKQINMCLCSLFFKICDGRSRN